MFKLTTLIENNSFDKHLEKEKGLSLLIDNKKEKIIFDFGLSNNYWDNAIKLGFNPSIFNIGVVSHGHQDHSGGVKLMVEKNMFHKVYANEKIFKGKYKNFEGNTSYIGIDKNLEQVKDRFEFFKDNIQISENIFAITDIKDGRLEDRYIDKDKKIDHFDDESFLVLKGVDGLHIITGCCHKGLKATLNRAKEVFPNEKIITVIGGLHTYDADYEFLQDTVNSIKKHNVKTLIVGHCTGANGIEYLSEQTDCNINLLYTGSIYILQ